MRFAKSLLLLIYLLSSLPVLASYHYCLGRVKQISFYEVAYEDCVCPEPETARDCCDDEQQLLDFQDDHAGVSATLLTLQGWEMLAVYPVAMPHDAGGSSIRLPLANAPPNLRTHQALFIAHQSFLL